jgi:hypothetical protein
VRLRFHLGPSLPAAYCWILCDAELYELVHTIGLHTVYEHSQCNDVNVSSLWQNGVCASLAWAMATAMDAVTKPIPYPIDFENGACLSCEGSKAVLNEGGKGVKPWEGCETNRDVTRCNVDA